MTREALEADEMRFLAVVKSIEMIGEAATKVSEGTQERVCGIDRRGIRRMRNRMIHGYDTIDPARVWDAVEIDIPGLIAVLEAELGPGPKKPKIQATAEQLLARGLVVLSIEGGTLASPNGDLLEFIHHEFH